MCAGGIRRGRYALRQDYLYENYEGPVIGTKKGLVPYTSKRKAPEASFQIQVARYLSKALPEGYFWTTIPSGGGGLVRGARLKAMGLRKGLPDMVIFGEYENMLDWQNNLYCNHPTVLWLELKAAKGSLSEDQKTVINELLNLGHRVEVVKTLDRVEAALAEFCFPDKLRARVQG